MSLKSVETTVQELFKKYENNEPFLKKIETYICINLPNKLLEIQKNNIARQNRIEYLNNETDKFIQDFLYQQDNLYFYISTSELFICYDGINYKIINEDDLLHSIFKNVSKNKELIEWKYKIRKSIIKKIKSISLLTTIPNSETIQSILDYMCKTFLISKDHAKYILTIIGDNFTKNENTSNLDYFTTPSFKKWFQCISDYSFFYFKYSKNPIENIKYKFYNHKFENCRLLHLKHITNQDCTFLKNNILNFICVSCHYSNRFKCADNFLNNHCNTPDLIYETMYLKNNSIEKILNIFKKELLEKTDDKTLFINEKNFLFLWKEFLQEKNLPHILFNQDLKQNVIQHLNISYNETYNYYEGYTSEKLNIIQNFITFWENNIIHDENEEDFEINELVSIYNGYLKRNNKSYIHYLNEDNCKNILTLFYDIELINNRYIPNIKCSFWNKKQDVINFLNNYIVDVDTSLYELYNIYCMISNKNNNIFTVSKTFFDKVIYENIHSKYINNSIISCKYWEF